jgi:hypothetical protein
MNPELLDTCLRILAGDENAYIDLHVQLSHFDPTVIKYGWVRVHSGNGMEHDLIDAMLNHPERLRTWVDDTDTNDLTVQMRPYSYIHDYDGSVRYDVWSTNVHDHDTMLEVESYPGFIKWEKDVATVTFAVPVF